MKKNGKLQGLLRTIGEYALSVGGDGRMYAGTCFTAT